MARKKQSQTSEGRPDLGSFLREVASGRWSASPSEVAPPTIEEDAQGLDRAADKVFGPKKLRIKVKALQQENESQKAELAALKADHEQLKAEVKTVNELPSLQEFRLKFQQLSQEQAANYLDCTTRSIRNMIGKGKLTKAKNGRVQCDDKWSSTIRGKFPNIRVM